MKDLPLSVLSRGCGQFVPCEGKQNGRLDVCFTPEDYHIWKARGPLLQLSTSNCVFTTPESTLPKTFSTRRGALLLYSQGLVTLTVRSSNSYERNYYGECSAQPIQQGEITSVCSILNNNGENESNRGLPTTTVPTLNLPHPPDLKYFETVHYKEPTSEHHVGIQLPLSADRDFLVQQSQHEDGHKKRIDVFLQMPSVTAESWNNMEAFTSENPLRTSVEQSELVEETDVPSGTQPSGSNSSNDHGKRYLDKASPKQSNTKQSKQGVLLPPLNTGQLVKFESYGVHPDRVKGEFFKEQCVDHLPSIEETLAGKTRGLSHKPLDVQPSKNTNVPLQPFLPRLVPEKYGEKAQKQRTQKTVNLPIKHETQNCRITEGHASDNYILLNPEEECTVPLGLLTGKRGPGRQSSLAFLQKLSDEYRVPNSTEVVRGVLPLELRDLNGQSVGSLILSPDGEIIQLSMLDHIQNCTQEQALQVVSAKGEKLPWIVMLQPEQHITSANENKKTGLQITDIQQGLSINTPPNPQRSTDSGPGSVKAYSDLDAMDHSDVKDTKSEINTRIKSPKLDAFNENIVPCLSTLDRTELETKSREDTALKDKKDLLSGQLSSLQQEAVTINKPNEIPATNINPSYAPEQNTVKDSKKLTKIKGNKESSLSNKAKRKDTRSTPNDQIASTKDREERKTLHDSQPDSGPDKNDSKPHSTNTTKGVKGKEAKTKDIKKTNDKSVNIDTVDAEDATIDRNKKKRRGKSKDKDSPSDKMTSDLLTDKIANSNQDTEEEANKQGTISLSAKQKHKNTKLDMIEDRADTDHFIIKEPGLKADKLSRSMRSLRSGASGSGLKHSSSQKSLSSSCEGGTFQGTTAPMSLSHSRLSSCSTVMIPEEQLMLNPTKSEVVMKEQSIINQDDYATDHQAEKMRIQREEEQRKRRQDEEEQRRQQQKEELEQRMRSELQNERQRRAEESRLKKQAEDEKKQQREEEEQRRRQRQQEQHEREMRRQQERKRQIELFQRKREEEEQRKRAETERLNLLEEKRLQEENVKLQEMSVSERAEYQRKKQEEEDKQEREEEEQRRREKEAKVLAAEKAKIEEELLAREMTLLHQRLSFKRGLMVESEGLEKSQGISRPWTYSYFTLLQLLGLSSVGEHHT